MPRLILCDGDLYAYALDRRMSETIEELRRILNGILKLECRMNSGLIMTAWNERCQVDRIFEVVKDAFNVCPRNLAELFLESANIYRLIASVALPDIYPLCNEMLRADIHSYFAPQRKPYRDHLPHQTRVAALAHILLSNSLPIPAIENHVEQVLDCESSYEITILKDYFIRKNPLLPFPCSERRRACVRISALLAGLLHDLGYILKVLEETGGGGDEALGRLGIFPSGGDFCDPPESPLTTMYREFYEATGTGWKFEKIRNYVKEHPDSPHSLAGALWLTYLPERLISEGLCDKPSDKNLRYWGELEFISQLGSMMVFAHDFPLDSEKKKGRQGFLDTVCKSNPMSKRYPLCTLFSLADILHEFGRPYVYTDSQILRVHSPVYGIDFRWPDEWSAMNINQRKKLKELELLDGNVDKPDDRVEIFWDILDKDSHFVVSNDMKRKTFTTLFDRKRIGEDVARRIKAWGLGKLLSQRDSREARIVEKKLRSIRGLGLHRTPPPVAGSLAIYPLMEYDDSERRFRERWSLRPLQ